MLAHCYGTPDILLSRATFNVISSTCAFVLLPLKTPTVVFTGAQLDANNFFIVNISAGGKKLFMWCMNVSNISFWAPWRLKSK